MSDRVLEIFAPSEKLVNIAEIRVGLDTSNNDLFIKYRREVNINNIGFNKKNINNFIESNKLYILQTKGGEYRKWHGNFDDILKFNQKYYSQLENSGNHLPSRQFYFREGASYTRISYSLFSIRYSPQGFVFNSACPTIFCQRYDKLGLFSALLSSKIINIFMSAMSPNLNFQAG